MKGIAGMGSSQKNRFFYFQKYFPHVYSLQDRIIYSFVETFIFIVVFVKVGNVREIPLNENVFRKLIKFLKPKGFSNLDPALSQGVLCNHPCWSVSGLSLDISETAH